jgi:hypothetical protein
MTRNRLRATEKRLRATPNQLAMTEKWLRTARKRLAMTGNWLRAAQKRLAMTGNWLRENGWHDRKLVAAYPAARRRGTITALSNRHMQ